MKFNKDREYLVLENQKLIHYVINCMGIRRNHPEYEDLVSIGNLGLIDAANNFDEAQNKRFSTYAYVCIKNKIRMHLRKSGNRNYPIISINDILPGTDGMTLEDTLEDTQSNFEKWIENKESLMMSINYILNCFPWRQRLAILYYMGEMEIADIAQRLNCSRQTVSALIWRVHKKFDGQIEWKKRYKEVYHMSIKGDLYQLTFLSKDIQQFNHIFASFLAQITSVTNIPNFEVLCNKERIIIKVQAHPQSFLFIARIIQEIDEFCLKFISGSGVSYIEDNMFEKNQGEIQKTLEEVEGTEKNVSITKDTRDYSRSKVSTITDCFLNLNRSFTISELKEKLPRVNDEDIRNAIYRAMKKGLIVREERGKYIVNR